MFILIFLNNSWNHSIDISKSQHICLLTRRHVTAIKVKINCNILYPLPISFKIIPYLQCINCLGNEKGSLSAKSSVPTLPSISGRKQSTLFASIKKALTNLKYIGGYFVVHKERVDLRGNDFATWVCNLDVCNVDMKAHNIGPITSEWIVEYHRPTDSHITTIQLPNWALSYGAKQYRNLRNDTVLLPGMWPRCHCW